MGKNDFVMNQFPFCVIMFVDDSFISAYLSNSWEIFLALLVFSRKKILNSLQIILQFRNVTINLNQYNFSFESFSEAQCGKTQNSLSPKLFS